MRRHHPTSSTGPLRFVLNGSVPPFCLDDGKSLLEGLAIDVAQFNPPFIGRNDGRRPDMGSVIRYSRTGVPVQYHSVFDSGIWFTGEFCFPPILAAVFLDVLAWNGR